MIENIIIYLQIITVDKTDTIYFRGSINIISLNRV
jgi:hypothetical protein